MKITLDISLYPLTEDFIPVIKGFIAKMETYQELSVLRNNISTQISGEYDLIMGLLKTELKEILKYNGVFLLLNF